MPIKFGVGNIPVAKFVSRTIVDSFLAHFIITISHYSHAYSDNIVIHRQSCMFSPLIVTGSWCMKISPYISLEMDGGLDHLHVFLFAVL